MKRKPFWKASTHPSSGGGSPPSSYPEAAAAFERFMADFGRYEYELGTWFDQWMCYASLQRLICEPETFYRAE
jgi:hypothetical protein